MAVEAYTWDLLGHPVEPALVDPLAGGVQVMRARVSACDHGWRDWLAGSCGGR